MIDMEPILYRCLAKYKYQLMKTISIKLDINIPESVNTPFIRLGRTGKLTVKKGYSWDGASGPTIDSSKTKRASLVHDALYQLMREELLDESWRKYADTVLRELLITDDMWGPRASTWYRMVRWFGGKALHKGTPQDKILTAP